MVRSLQKGRRNPRDCLVSAVLRVVSSFYFSLICFKGKAIPLSLFKNLTKFLKSFHIFPMSPLYQASGIKPVLGGQYLTIAVLCSAQGTADTLKSADQISSPSYRNVAKQWCSLFVVCFNLGVSVTSDNNHILCNSLKCSDIGIKVFPGSLGCRKEYLLSPTSLTQPGWDLGTLTESLDDEYMFL